MTANNKKMSRRSKQRRSNRSNDGRAQTENARQSPSAVASIKPVWLWLSGLSMLAVLVWSYWPTLGRTVYEWNRQPDYSHGFLVLPISLFFLWFRRRSFPGDELQPAVLGGVILVLACALRIVVGLYYLESLDGWTFPLWVAGTVWLLLGFRCLLWSLPSVIFLWFMFPIPYSAERWFSVPLQAVATKLSTACLLVLGQPALSEGNTIWLGDHQLFVEEACSGLRIFVGIFALAFAYILFSRWAWWQKAMVLVAALPVAILANMARIVATGLLYQFASGEAAKRFSHDLSGVAMIPLAAVILWLFLVYLGRLFPDTETVSPIPTDTSA